MNLLCRIGVHKRAPVLYSPLSPDSQWWYFSSAPVAKEWYCERCGYSERYPVMEWDGTDNG